VAKQLDAPHLALTAAAQERAAVEYVRRVV
jgi:hypothetical protein